MRGWVAALCVGLMACSGSSQGDGAVDAGPDAPPILEDAGRAETAPGSDASSCANPLAWYPDADGDGHGSRTASPTMACTPPTGFVADRTDCADEDARAWPGTSAFYPTPITGKSDTLAFDFDCDGLEAPEKTGAGSCTGSGSSCAAHQQMWNGTAPGCGAQGYWITVCQAQPSCYAALDPRTQACK